MDRWRGRVAVVTGASAGIGAAICKLLAKDGMKVVGCARRQEKVEEIAQNHPNIYPRKVTSYVETIKDRYNGCIKVYDIINHDTFHFLVRCW